MKNPHAIALGKLGGRRASKIQRRSSDPGGRSSADARGRRGNETQTDALAQASTKTAGKARRNPREVFEKFPGSGQW
jgi:hypothetical protein